MIIDHVPHLPNNQKKILTFQWEEDGQVYMETHLFTVDTPHEQIQQKSNCPLVCKNHPPQADAKVM